MYKINRTAAIASLLAGLLAFGLCYYMHASWEKSLSGVWLTALLFAVLYVISFAAVAAASFLTRSFDRDSFLTGTPTRWLCAALAGLCLTFSLSLGLEWLYERDFFQKKWTEPTSYVFVIDESGSMEDSDPSGQRYAAIREIIREKDSAFPFMVYAFGDEPRLVRGMKPIREGYEEIPPVSDGGTAIGGTVERLWEDYQNGVWTDRQNPKVIFLTDGYATDLTSGVFQLFGSFGLGEFQQTLRQFAKAGVEISTVGLGDVDERLLRHMAETTGGTFIRVGDAAGLSDSMREAAVSSSGRTLLTRRYVPRGDWVYALMRIAFLFLIGAAAGASMLIPYGSDESTPAIIAGSIGEGLLGALLMEGGLQAGISQGILWCVLWMLLALTVGYVKTRTQPKEICTRSQDRFLHVI